MGLNFLSKNKVAAKGSPNVGCLFQLEEMRKKKRLRL
jgi:hypothetical protein